MNGLTMFQIKGHNKYSGADFDGDRRQVLCRSGCKDEKICSIRDESNVMDSSFWERMNALQANSESKEGAQKQGLMLETNEELYKWFTQQVMKNLRVVFTMNPSTDGHKGREFTIKMDLDQPSYRTPVYFPMACPIGSRPPNHRDTAESTPWCSCTRASTSATPRSTTRAAT